MPLLKASYTSPAHEPFAEERDIPASSSSSSSSSTAPASYLDSLRAAVASVQESVNRELTARMVMDAEASAGGPSGGGGNGGNGGKSRAAKKGAAPNEDEEDAYGEEAMEED